ncbi:hypothetical protein NC653_012385 [Populus alba x Populus x berolinensis]|uniref:Uncharacterized protein n=1 Tax=Populus alba x Populus x berolinensis TaxID=444605 RepID=A0AAD6R4L2_9ROSI|nr:hypothetical protein NC653_012385 [Populus alba x Populus x berolinensis]
MAVIPHCDLTPLVLGSCKLFPKISPSMNYISRMSKSKVWVMIDKTRNSNKISKSKCLGTLT